MEGLWYEPTHELSTWNPKIYESCALYEDQCNIYQSFSECVKRVLQQR